MNGSDSSFSRLCNFAVGPVLEPPDHIAHAWWCIFTYKKPQYQTIFCMDFYISLGTTALRFECVPCSTHWQINRPGNRLWQLGSWHCTSDPYDTAAGCTSTWLKPKSSSYSSYGMGMGGCKHMHLEQLPLSKLRGKTNARLNKELRKQAKCFPGHHSLYGLCACPLLVFGNGSCLKSVKLLFEGVALAVMPC